MCDDRNCDRRHSDKRSRPLGHELFSIAAPRLDRATPQRSLSGGRLLLDPKSSWDAARLTRRLFPAFFVFPGGRLDPADYTVRAATRLSPIFVKNMGVYGNAKKAEALAIAAVRETLEETGLLVAQSGNIGTPTHPGWSELESTRACSRIGPPLLFWPCDHVTNE